VDELEVVDPAEVPLVTGDPDEEEAPEVLAGGAPLDDEVEAPDDVEDVDDVDVDTAEEEETVDVVLVAAPVEVLVPVEVKPLEVDADDPVDEVDEAEEGAVLQRALWQVSPAQQSSSFWQ